MYINFSFLDIRRPLVGHQGAKGCLPVAVVRFLAKTLIVHRRFARSARGQAHAISVFKFKICFVRGPRADIMSFYAQVSSKSHIATSAP